MMTPPEQLDFESLMFGADRKALNVHEVSEKLRVTDQHVLDLIEEGALQAVNVGGESDSLRVPRTFILDLGRRLGWSEQQMFSHLESHRRQAPRQRKLWRIPIEAYRAFLERRHSFEAA